MTEEDLEIEIVNNNQLLVIIKENELSEDKSKILFARFANFFSDAELWAKKAKLIKVTNESQKVIMDQARQGRLFLRKIRLDIENCRKDLKEQSLREGRAIDKVAKVLKEQIEPIEEYLDRQEHFVEYKEAEKEAIIQAEVATRMEQERLAEEKRKSEELEVTRRENERLRMVQEKADISHREAIRKANEENEKALQIEREKSRKAEEELRLKKQAELKADADAIRKAQALKSADDVVKLKKLLDDLNNIDWPDCNTVEGKKVRLEANSHIYVGTTKITTYLKSKQVNEEDL